ncbi:MAG: branched-chain amino acid transaminase [Chloroflexota bacterium]|nr:branched-chain amino acid transaminase [Chloroflexota bacterium]
MQSKFIWMDGELVPYEQATVHFLTPSLHYGVSIFEGLRCYKTDRGAAVFRLREHIQRFLDSAHIMGIRENPYTLEELRQAIFDTIRANGFAKCYIRPLMYLDGPLGLKLDKARPVVGIAVWEWETYHGEKALDQGLRMVVSSYTRMHPNINMTKAKVAGNYVNSMLAKTDALRMGFDEVIMLDQSGFVAESSGMNLFMVRGGSIYTPARAAILEGITRDAVITLIGDLGYPLIEEPISRDQLYVADEIFLCGTAAEVVPVREIDFRQIGAGSMGPVTKIVQDAFFEVVRGDGGTRSSEWLDYVPPD